MYLKESDFSETSLLQDDKTDVKVTDVQDKASKPSRTIKQQITTQHQFPTFFETHRISLKLVYLIENNASFSIKFNNKKVPYNPKLPEHQPYFHREPNFSIFFNFSNITK